MEFRFDLAACVGAPPDHEGPCVGYVDERALRGPAGGYLGTVLEELGLRSAAAQGLKRPVTHGSASGLGDQRVYVLACGRQALGLLKVGKKRLFVAAPPPVSNAAVGGARARQQLADVQGALREMEPLCVLDFYVHERCQRSGHGRRLFDTMVAREQVAPQQLAYDRPSPKLLSFMQRHFGLARYTPQSNNFVVYDAYFDQAAEQPFPQIPCGATRLGGLGESEAPGTGRRGPGPSARRSDDDLPEPPQRRSMSGMLERAQHDGADRHSPAFDRGVRSGGPSQGPRRIAAGPPPF